MSYRGVIIEESLEDASVLKFANILSTETEPAVDRHKTPWVRQWTLHDVEIADDLADDIAVRLSRSLDRHHNWYADFRNDRVHYIIFRDKVFKVDRKRPEEYKDVVKYGLSVGIPDYQLDFSPDIKSS